MVTLIIGIILEIAGIIGFYYARNQMTSMEYGFGSAFGWGDYGARADTLDMIQMISHIAMIVGGILILLGIVQVIFKMAAKSKIQPVYQQPQSYHYAPAQSNIPVQPTETCSGCGKAMTAGAAFCNHCGAKRETPPACPSCGKEVTVGVAFCNNCGAKQ
jgi:hypothetical protein